MRRKLYTKVIEPAPVNVWIPYTKPSTTLQTTINCLRAQSIQPNLCKVGDDDRYWQMLRDRWTEGEPFFVVEQDVFVWHGAIKELHECQESRGWCTLPTICHGRVITTTLGCVRFSEKSISQNPGFWDDIDSTWYFLDAGLADKMGWPYIKPHTHWPIATHLNETQWSDHISSRYSLEHKMHWQSRESGGTIVNVKYRLAGDSKKDKRVVHATVDRSGWKE